METFEKWIQISGPLFEAVQKSAIFEDDKRFVDMIPKRDPEAILKSFNPNGDLKTYVEENFFLPQLRAAQNPVTDNMHEYIFLMWDTLLKEMKSQGPYDTLLSLPHPHIVPGGRFRECYYWDSYFVILALLKVGRAKIAHGMVKNFAYQIDHFGFIPNGNRVYYLTRSQPPFFRLMVEATGLDFSEQVAIEQAYWKNHQVEGFYRYVDETNSARPEAYLHDLSIGRYQHLRAACASGWDFSARWFKDPKDLSSICTLDILPVDLNMLLYAEEDFFWNPEEEFYGDYNHVDKAFTSVLSLAGVFPLFMKVAPAHRAQKVAERLERDFLLPGGLQTTLIVSGQQWDAPLVWAPLQWIAIEGLRHYGFDALAEEIARRFKAMTSQLFAKTGMLFEKYDGRHIDRLPDEGEYKLQEGFGWTNAVLTLLS